MLENTDQNPLEKPEQPTKPAPVYKSVLQLHKALEAAGLPVISVQSSGEIQYTKELTPDQKAQLPQLIADYEVTQALEEQAAADNPLPPVDLQTIVTALWAAIANNDPALVEIIKENIKP